MANLAQELHQPEAFAMVIQIFPICTSFVQRGLAPYNMRL